MLNKNQTQYHHIFGPIPSRRLGMSLGVDLMPHKTCTLNCVYCECGKTTRLTLDTEEYLSTESIIKELRSFLLQTPELDYITFSGFGEPTLHSGIGKVVDFIKKNYPQYRVALLTNSTLFPVPEVRKNVINFDTIIASLDTVTEENFIKINRPHEGLKLGEMLKGLISLREEFSNQLWIEIFIVPGLNDTQIELKNLKKLLNSIKPDKIQLNSLDRPGTEPWVQPVNSKTLSEISDFLSRAEIVEYSHAESKKNHKPSDLNSRVLNTIQRRPCTGEDISRMLGISLIDAMQNLYELEDRGEIEKRKMARGEFYTTR